MKTKIISLLSEVKRDGIDNLIKFVSESNYLTTARCYSHHKTAGGLMNHSLEVFDVMMKSNRGRFSRESIILVALCHDLGKARMHGHKVGEGAHWQRSVQILEMCGVPLTNEEREAILFHHPSGAEQILKAATRPLQVLLHKGDCVSTWVNKEGRSYVFSTKQPAQ